VEITVPGSTPPPPPADTTAPGAPGTLGGQVRSGPLVALSWGAATDNVGVAGYRLYRAGLQVGTTGGTTYTDSAPPTGVSVSYTVRAYDAAGNLGAASNAFTVTIPATSPAPPPPGDTPPANDTKPTISGSAQQGSMLTATVGTWTGTTPVRFTFRWLRCDSRGNCNKIGGATGSTYRLTTREVNRKVRVIVTASNAKGSAGATSAATATVHRSGAATTKARDAGIPPGRSR
jgi:chitinase